MRVRLWVVSGCYLRVLLLLCVSEALERPTNFPLLERLAVVWMLSRLRVEEEAALQTRFFGSDVEEPGRSMEQYSKSTVDR